MGRDRTAKFHNRFKRRLVRRWCWGNGATRASRPMQAHGWGELRVGASATCSASTLRPMSPRGLSTALRRVSGCSQ